MKMFTMSVTIDGQEFTGKASCKKLAKAEAAKQALIQLYNFKVPQRKYFLIFICQVTSKINEPVNINTKKMICVSSTHCPFKPLLNPRPKFKIISQNCSS